MNNKCNYGTCIMNMNTCGGSAFSVYNRGGGGMEPLSAINYSYPSMTVMNSSSGYGLQFREQSHIPTYHNSSLMKLQEDGHIVSSISSTPVHYSYETSTVSRQPTTHVQHSYHRHVPSPPNSIERLPPIQSLLNDLNNDIPYLLPTIKETFHNDFQHANSYSSSPSPMQNNNIMYGYTSSHSDVSNSSTNVIWNQNEITSSSPVHTNSLSNRLLHSPNNSDQKPVAATAPTQSKRREKIEMSSLISKQDYRIKKQSTKKEDSSNLGQWNAEEHKQFLLGLSQVGENYKLIGKLYVKTRSRRQIVNHAHKYLKRRSAK